MFLIVRAKIGVNSLAEPLRRALSEIDPELPLANVRPLETVASAAVATRRLSLSCRDVRHHRALPRGRGSLRCDCAECGAADP
jgi:hypothetical protein